MFKNEPLTDFTVEANRKEMHSALTALEAKISSGSLQAFPIISGNEIKSGKKFEREDPSDTDTLIGTTHFATVENADAALKSLAAYSGTWRRTPANERAAVLHKAASIMRQRKFHLNALIIREAGKSWKEADGDVAEAIDFCDYYAEEMLRLAPPVRTQEVPGEDNFYLYQPRGICVVISPWNFPLAIACGMTVAALVTGNVTVLKPSEQTGLIAYEFSKILLEAGLPKEAYAFLPGVGEEIGEFLVNSPSVNMICFTGSKAVGLHIIQRASIVHPEQHSVKRVVAEMGGKNAVIVDEDADLDEAIRGILQSAFGFSGQKCSACSRLIVVGNNYETLLARLAESAADLVLGKAQDPSVFTGPVIDRESQTRILETISEAKKNHSVLLQGHQPTGGYFVPLTIFRDVDTQSALWKEEIFGPVLAITQAKSFEHAVTLANQSQYALTGGLFSRSPKNIQFAREEFAVGNLYINRGCTGALVCRQPFGGFKMSGVGSKAGGPDYLIQFMEPRVITENTMRKGFAP